MKNKRIIIFVAAVVLLVVGVLALSNDLMSPYVSFDKAKESAGDYVQVIGLLDKSTPVEQTEAGFTFVLLNDDGEKLQVHHGEAKPVNFEHADNAVVLGRYNSSAYVFEADKVLVKCPSKYEKKAGQS